MICFFRTKSTLTGSTGAMVERGQDSSTSPQHSPWLQAGVSASPIPRNVWQPHSCGRIKPDLVIYKLLLRCFQTLLHFYLCEWPEKRNSGADSHAERWNWPSLASSSLLSPISDQDMQHPLLANSYGSPPATEDPWKSVNASPSQFISFSKLKSALRKKFRLHLIRYSSKRRQRS